MLSNENALITQDVESLKTVADFKNKYFEKAKWNLEQMREINTIVDDIKLMEYIKFYFYLWRIYGYCYIIMVQIILLIVNYQRRQPQNLSERFWINLI